MQSCEISLDQHLTEIIDTFDPTTPAYGIIAYLQNNEADLSNLSPKQREVWDRIICPAVKSNQERYDRLLRMRLMDEKD
jgi:hypothetical protein